MKNALNILIGGEAGQGLVTLGEILAKSLVRAGYYILVTQSYMSRIRGGHNTFAIQVSPDEVIASRDEIDLLVALDNLTLTLHEKDLTPRGRIVADQECSGDEKVCLKVPFGHLASDQFSNIAALGVVSGLIGLKEEVVGRTLEDFFGKKAPGVAEENRKVLGAAMAWTLSQPPFMGKLPPVPNPTERMMMQGNEAIALGAISAGLKFYSFYPMTPSTSIGQTLAKWAGKMGLVVEQAEDEIAAVNMALGASYAGAPSMVGTSGGGFALMGEGVSLAGMTETPIVIAVAQRPGPATGLPTRTEQADLQFVLYAGHGEFPRAIFAPGTVEECFHLTRRAFFLAEKYQGPVFILTDQFLSDSYRSVNPFQIESLPSVQVPLNSEPGSPPYRRYDVTESGVSPRLIPGMSEQLVVAGSDEHTEDGHLTEDLSARKQMADKRMRKADGIRREVVPPELKGDLYPDLLLVTWGSTRGAVLEAASQLRSGGRKTATLYFPQVWPLVPEQFLSVLQGAGQVVSVEGNATGQLAKLIRQESGFEIKKRVGRYDGLPITTEYILRELNGRRG
jgi:2-oxoglutarate ferredoxin oxidoreductase subunit alpha